MVGRVSPPSNTPQAPAAIPKLVKDPIWSLRQWPVVVEAGGVEYTIPALCAADWLVVLMDPGMTAADVFPGLLPEDERYEVGRRLHALELDVFETEDLGLEIISTVTGRPWWVALRLVHTVRSYWEVFGGELAAVDATRLSVAAYLDVLLPLILQNMQPEQRTMFLLKLEIAPQGWEEDPEQLEMSPESFMAMANQQ